MLKKSDRVRIKSISDNLYKASRRVKILRHLNWPDSVRHQFFSSDSEKLPQIEYPNFESEDTLKLLKKTSNLMGDTPFDNWLKIKLNDILVSIDLLNHTGEKEFHNISSKIYGLPTGLLRDGETTPLDLANKFISVIETYNNNPLIKPKRKKIKVVELRQLMENKVKEIFGKHSPDILIMDGMSAKATATSKYIKLRKGASFTQKDVDQLINHEALVHVATTLNGRAQDEMKILGGNYGAVTKTQEGLAVFSEFITGSIDVERMYRITDRVIAIQMAIEGASFIDIYRFFLERNSLKADAFENARRVFRGGVLTGGAPFTKDIVYLDGLVRVHNFFRTVVAKGRQDILKLLFSGKITLDDIPMLMRLKKEKLIKTPKFLPYWIEDMDYLVCYFSFSVFMDDINYENVEDYYEYL